MPRNRQSWTVIGLAAVVAGSAAGQTICVNKITDFEAINPYGARPAIHNGLIAFLGENKTTGISGIFTAPADGAGPLTVIADEATFAPNAASTFFQAFWNPDIHDGQVVFAARYDGSNIDGIYQGDGDGLVTLVDHGPADNRDAIGPEGVVWETNAGFSTPFFKPVGQAWFPIVSHGDPMPGGGTFVDVDPDDPALEGGHVTLAAYVSHKTGVDGGVYLYDVETDALNLVANWTVQMPGRDEFFDYFSQAHTDGERVVMVGKSGFIGFGGHQGLYTAPAVSAPGEPAPLTLITELGDLTPAGDPFTQFGDVAVQGDLIIFQASFETDGGGGLAIFGKRGDGPIFRIVGLGDTFDDITPTTIDWNFRGLDQNQIVFRGTIGPPPGGGTFNYALFSATILEDGAKCPEPGGGEPPTEFEACREWSVAAAPDADTTLSVRDVEIIDENDIWIVGGDGFAAHWNGAAWTTEPTPPVDDFNVSLENVDADPQGNVWAVGQYYNGSKNVTASFRRAADGGVWTHVPTPSPGPTYNYLWGVEAIGPTEAWAVGEVWLSNSGSEFFVLHFDGESWSEFTLPDLPDGQYNNFQGVSSSGPDNVWIVGTSDPVLTYEAVFYHYNGETWAPAAGINQPSNSTSMYDIDVVSPTLAYAVGSQFVTGLGHQTFAMKFDGASWTPMLTPNPGIGWNFLFGVAATDEDHVYATGYHYYGAVNEPITLHWNAGADTFVGTDMEMVGYSTTAWAAGALPNGDGLAVGTIGYYGGAPADVYLRSFSRPGGPADLDCDGAVGSSDLAALLSVWNTADAIADLSRDGVVGAADLAMMLSEWQ